MRPRELQLNSRYCHLHGRKKERKKAYMTCMFIEKYIHGSLVRNLLTSRYTLTCSRDLKSIIHFN
jgi:hypothetical protein